MLSTCNVIVLLRYCTKKVKEAANDQYNKCVSDLDMFNFYVGLTLVRNC